MEAQRATGPRIIVDCRPDLGFDFGRGRGRTKTVVALLKPYALQMLFHKYSGILYNLFFWYIYFV